MVLSRFRRLEPLEFTPCVQISETFLIWKNVRRNSAITTESESSHGTSMLWCATTGKISSLCLHFLSPLFKERHLWNQQNEAKTRLTRSERKYFAEIFLPSLAWRAHIFIDSVLALHKVYTRVQADLIWRNNSWKCRSPSISKAENFCSMELYHPSKSSKVHYRRFLHYSCSWAQCLLQELK